MSIVIENDWRIQLFLFHEKNTDGKINVTNTINGYIIIPLWLNNIELRILYKAGIT